MGDQTHHVIYNCSAADKEKNSDLKEFLEFVKSNKAESDFTKEIANMVQTKKFEQSFVNEYLAWNLHDQDVEKRSNIETAKRLLAMGLPIETVAEGTKLAIDFIKSLVTTK